MDITGQFQQIEIFLTDDRFVAVLKEMATPFVFQIVPDGITCQKTPHEFRDAPRSTEHQEMDVIIHEHEGIDQETVLVSIMRKDFQKFRVIGLIPEYRLPLIPPDYYVIECTLKLYPWFPGHTRKISALSSNVNKQV